MRFILLFLFLLSNLTFADMDLREGEGQNIYEYSYGQLQECQLEKQVQLDMCTSLMQNEEYDYLKHEMYIFAGMVICGILAGAFIIMVS